MGKKQTQKEKKREEKKIVLEHYPFVPVELIIFAHMG